MRNALLPLIPLFFLMLGVGMAVAYYDSMRFDLAEGDHHEIEDYANPVFLLVSIASFIAFVISVAYLPSNRRRPPTDPLTSREPEPEFSLSRLFPRL